MILVTGGLGYIGSHIVIMIPYPVLILDNLSNSFLDRFYELQKIKPDIELYQGDYTNICTLDYIFTNYDITAVIHLAALKSVPESVREPEKYYIHNTLGTMTLLNAMKNFKLDNFIFSSSACVYKSHPRALKETDVLEPSNPYGKSKVDIEKYLQCIALNSISLRYFNPIGGVFREEKANNVCPIIASCIKEERIFQIMGTDYPTKDGTAIRDYISVMDVATGHIAALEMLLNRNCHLHYQKVYNLGVGEGTSVQQLVDCVNNLTGYKLQYECTGRRPGDVSHLIANSDLIRTELNWKPRHTLVDCVQDIIKIYAL